jgi:two-component system CheB/CheR fusion protein
MAGISVLEVTAPEDRQRVQDDMQTMMATGNVMAMECTMRKKDGTSFPAELSWSSTFDRKGRPAGITIAARDITERKRALDALQYRARHDALTGLSNRSFFAERLEQTLAVAQRDNTSFALLLMDLDGFKQVNDTLGHQMGDQLLQHLASRMGTALRESDTLARLGGDEFAVLLSTADMEGARLAACRLVDAVSEPLAIADRHMDVGISIGMALFPEHGEDAETLTERADIAMYRAKRTGQGPTLYQNERTADSSHPSDLVSSVSSAA